MFDLFGTKDLDPSAAARLRRLERKVDLILKHLGIEDAEAAGLGADVRALADAGQTIAAIKAYRDQTGAGLADAKEAVEAYMGRGGAAAGPR